MDIAREGYPEIMSRPTKRTREIEQTVLEGLRLGTPLAQLCRQEGMPSDETWRNWCKADAELSKAYADARDAGFDTIAAEVLTIIDTRDEDPASRRVRAEYRLKLLAKWDPKRYGDRVDMTSSDGSVTLGAPVYKIVTE
ncbi:hypothetical protein [Novosphingobium jiangmenense]|uniref:Terminase small subunit n=1 Tax=Novosphingobium jiangmenense TaxID=2791981 RepID=A0ABS0HG29_9SPHN|nr:hypothetical protein [Novosphingobium jiangmenense]MBF9150894.1 hypothetical protein [Novosphingobium jiangmenense]